MQPWRISVGLTAALAGSAILLVGSRLEYLVYRPRFIWTVDWRGGGVQRNGRL